MDQPLIKLALILVFGMGALAALKMVLGRLTAQDSVRAPEGPLPYRKCKHLMTAAERTFFQALDAAVAGRYRIYAKVRIEDLIFVPRNADNRQGLRNRIKSRHVDFVLCVPATMEPILAIELDDSSHLRASRQQRDLFVNKALSAAGLPLLRVAVSRAYDIQNLAMRIAAVSGQRATAA